MRDSGLKAYKQVCLQSLDRDFLFAMLLTLDNPKVHFHYPRSLATLLMEMRYRVGSRE